MTMLVNLRSSSKASTEMALVLFVLVVGAVRASGTGGEMALANVTRFASGDLFSLVGMFVIV